MGLLDKEFEKTGVEQESPPAEEATTSEETAEAAAESEGTEESKEDRPNENFYREALRKTEQSNRLVLEKLDQGFSKLANALTPKTQSATPAAEPASTGNPLDRFTVEELNAAVADGRIPDSDKPGMQLYLAQRIARETSQNVTKQTLSKHTAETGEQQMRRDSLKKAIELYPDIRTYGSKFRVAVDEEIERRGQTWVDSNPMAILDAAYAVAARTNVKPAERFPSGRPANRTDNAAPVETNEPVSMLQGADRDKVEAKLSDALGLDKDGKPRKFDRKTIDASAAYYQKHGHLFIKK